MSATFLARGSGLPATFLSATGGQATFYYAASADWGSVSYTTPGTYSWTAPAGVTSVCVVCIGGGASGTNTTGNGTEYGGNSYFINTTTVMGIGGPRNASGASVGVTAGGGYVGDGGGVGGRVGSASNNWPIGGGGAGGYTGTGGRGTDFNAPTATSGTGGAGGGGSGITNNSGAGGGGTGLFGQGANGTASATLGSTLGLGGGGGSGGTAGSNATTTSGGTGGLYGGGGGSATGFWLGGGGGGLGWKNNIPVVPGNSYTVVVGGGGGTGANGAGSGTNRGNGGLGGGGAVRIIWGSNRAFPATNVSTGA